MIKKTVFFLFALAFAVALDFFVSSPVDAETTFISPDEINITDLNLADEFQSDPPFLLAQNEKSKSASSKKTSSRKKMETREGPGITTISANLGFETSPGGSGWNTGYGLGIGADFYHVQDIELRADLNYKTWSQSAFGVDLSYTRVPVIVSGRMYFPMDEKTRLYAQGGLGLSFDSASAAVPYFCGFNVCYASASSSTTNVELLAAGGFQAQITPVIALGVEADLHIVDNSYFSLMGTLSYALER